MGLELKLESLRARGMLTAEERDHLVQALQAASATSTLRTPPPRRRGLLTPLRTFLLGMIAGVGVAYLTWWVLLVP